MKKERSRKFCILLYMDNEKHKKALEIIKNSYNYALIVHDKDTNKNGEIKKEHIHVVIENKNAIWNTSLASTLNIESRFIEKCRNFEYALMYLIHYNDNTKHQYSIDSVQGNLKEKLINFLNKNVSEETHLKSIFEYINNSKDIINITDISCYIFVNGIWSTFRRNFNIIVKLIDEHNLKQRRKELNNECQKFFKK